MAIKPKRLLKEKIQMSESLIAHFETGETPVEVWAYPKKELKLQWRNYEKNLLPGWIKTRPCSRPWGWWEYAAPRWARKFEAYFDGTLPEPRRRLGGVGDPAFEHLAYVPRFEYGLPTTWVTGFDEEYYNGRARDIHGNPIITDYKPGDFEGKAIDPDNPPVFESEAAYLDRLGLLTATERTYLQKHLELLEPEGVEFDDE